MASSSNSVSVPPEKFEYDVFISFRGEDTRAGFTSHLHTACKSHFNTYIDNMIQKGERVWGELVKAIKGSALLLVVFSENYASSTWCLNELVEIMECHKKGQAVIPVFYQTEPSHVRKQTGSYGTAMAEHNKQGMENMQKWKDALSVAASLCGFDSTTYRTDSALIEEIIKVISGKLDQECTNRLPDHFISDENYWHIESLIKNNSRKVQIIGLWGMGGIGKTTLAHAIFHEVSSQYGGSCFLDVEDQSKRHGIIYMRNILFSELLREDIHVDTYKGIPTRVMRKLKWMKAFIVLDNVHNPEVLQNLIGEECGWLGAGSKVIVTTRDQHVLLRIGVDTDSTHPVKEMNSQNSLQLFSWNAFKKVLPNEEFVELSKKAIDYAKGNPLALKVLGSFLYKKSNREWDSALAKLKETPNADIQMVLRLSYDELDVKEKKIFLDIACFFKGHERDRVIKVLNNCGFFADIGIKDLLNKALLTIDFENCIEMHDLIQEMGKQIVREESLENPEQRSRLWDHKEVCDVLKNNRGAENVEAIFLDLTQIRLTILRPKAFEKMPNLRLLAFQDHKGTESVSLPSGLDSLPKQLRYLLWDGYPLKSLPSTFLPEKLVELSLRYSNMEKLWNGVPNLPNLEKLDLSHSKRLIKCPNVSGSPNLTQVLLYGCERLPIVDPSIFSLQKVEVLNFARCKSLKRISSNICPPSLRELSVFYCPNLREFSIPLSQVRSKSDMRLSIGWWGLNKLPSSIMHLRNVGRIFFPISDSLKLLPENFTGKIFLSKPSEHESVTQSPIVILTLRNVLPSPVFQNLGRLLLCYCHSLSEIPDNISLLSSLLSLILFDIGIRCLPETIKDLPQLQHLEVAKCKMLQSIPTLPQSTKFFFGWNCESLQPSAPFKKSRCRFLLLNCIEFDPYLYDPILDDAITSIELGAILGDPIWYFLPIPAISHNFRDRFHFHNTQQTSAVTVELPPNVLGFVYYLVLSQGRIGFSVEIRCNCYLESSSGERIEIASFVRGECESFTLCDLDYDTSIDMMSDYVVLVHNARCCKKIMKAIEEQREAINDEITCYDPKLTFRFSVEPVCGEEVAIKECGFSWIFHTKDQVEEGRRKSKSMEIHELEASAVQNIDGEQKQLCRLQNLEKDTTTITNLCAALQKKGIMDDSSAFIPMRSRTRRAMTLTGFTGRHAPGERYHVKFDPVTFQPTGTYAKSYVGCLAHSKASINESNWKGVHGDVKKMIWQDIMQTFTVPDDKPLKKKLFSYAGERWKQFKTILSKTYVFGKGDKDGDTTPFGKYSFMSEESWPLLVQSRRDEEFQAKRQKGNQNAAKNLYPHRMSRGGYVKLKETIAEERLKEMTEDLGDEGSILDELPEPIRHELWLMAQQKSSGHYTSEAIASLAARIEELVEQSTQGSFFPHGRQDILTTTIGTQEHPGRVRTVGWGVGLKKYYGGPTRPTSGAMSGEVLQAIRQEIRREMQQELWEKMQKEIRDEISINMREEIQKGVLETLQSMGVSNYNAQPDCSPRATVHVSTKGSNCAPDIEDQAPRENFVEKLKNLKGDSFQVDLEHDSNVHPWFMIDRRDVDEIIDRTLWLSSHVLSLWCTYLHRFCIAKGNSDLFGFFDPVKIASSKHSLSAEAVQFYIENKIDSEPKKCYLGPYLHSDHWQLFVICPSDNIVVWLCSLHYKPNDIIKGIIDRAIRRYNHFKGFQNKKPKWVKPKGPRQNNGWACGYYVMKSMLTIVSADIVEGWEKIFNDSSAYGSPEIEDVRQTWEKFFLQMIEEKESKTKENEDLEEAQETSSKTPRQASQ